MNAEFLVEKRENMYPEYDDFYEPSEGEMFFDEMKEKFREILREDVNSEINRLTKENAELRQKVKEYNDKNLDLSRRENDLQYKMDNYKREVENDFTIKQWKKFLRNF